MEAVSSLLTVTLVSLLAVISPGPDFLIVVKNSLSYSRKMGFYTAIGIAVALLIHLTYTLVGIGMLIREGSTFYLIVKYAGATYLFYIGLKGFLSSLKKQKPLEVGSSTISHFSSGAALKQGFLTNLLNPKCALFFVSLFSQFVTPGTPLSLKIGFACINWSITLGWFLFLSYLITGKYLLTRIGSFRMYIDRIMGVILMLLSIKLFC